MPRRWDNQEYYAEYYAAKNSIHRLRRELIKKPATSFEAKDNRPRPQQPKSAKPNGKDIPTVLAFGPNIK